MKTFVFDVDGVICTGGSFSVALEAEYHIPREKLAGFFQNEFPECIVGRRDLKTALKPYLPAWGWTRSVDDFLGFWFQREHILCPHVLAYAQRLRASGHLCVLGTNQEKYRAAYLTREMQLGKSFDRVFASCDLGVAKPSLDFFHLIETNLAVPPENLCLIDDAQKNVHAALTCGWTAIHYRGPADVPSSSDQCEG